VRTLWITNDLPPRAGGIQQFVDNLLRRCDPARAVVLGPAEEGSAAHDAAVPYEVVRAPGGVWPTRAVRERAIALGRVHRPDVVVLGASWPLGELAGALREALQVPVVALSHGLEAGMAGAGGGRLIARATRDLAAVTTISDYTEQRLRPHLRAGRVVRVPPGVDVDVLRPGTGDLRAVWGVPADAPLVGCVSRLVRRKGQDTLLAAWPAILERHPAAWLAIVGTGPLETRLRREAAGLRQVVVTGAVSWSDLPAAYATLNVFAMPCRTRLAGLDVEGLGIVYLEAQACGVPVVAGRSGGAPEAVDDRRTGIVVDGGDTDAVVDAIDMLLGDDDRRAAMGAAGHSWVHERWAWDAIADRFTALLADVTGS
jgi:phosphatidyl-myo-inositol dimannoside synthase